MSGPFGFDRHISAWLDEQASAHEPEDLADVVLARTRRTRQLPGWATLERWLPMETRYKFGAVPKVALVLVLLGMLLAVVSAIAVGQQPSLELPSPFGVARSGLIAFDDGGDIYVVGPELTDPVALTSGLALDSSPEWSPDGTRIAYFSQQDANDPAAIVLMDADGSDPRTLVQGITIPDVSWHVSWSNDGRSLAYADRLDSVDRIMVVPVDGGDPVEVVSPGQAPTWSPDDQTIAYQSGGRTTDGQTVRQGLSVIDATGTDQRLIDGTTTTNPWAYAYPQWSQDGTQIAYHTAPLGGINGIYVAAADGSSTSLVGDAATDRVWPVWSPDGTRISYSGRSPDDTYQIGVMDADGTNITTLVHPPLGCNCAFRWSPDGTRVVAWMDGPLEQGLPISLHLVTADAVGSSPAETFDLSSLIGGHMSWQRLAP